MAQSFFDEKGQRGINHQIDDRAPEGKVTFEWFKNPDATYINYGCHIECFLDSGVVLHKALPQFEQPVDTLGTYDLAAPGGAKVKVGENLVSAGNYTDVLQRMATSTYRFLLKGFGVRVGYQVPVPSIKSVAGIPATPTEQWVRGNEVIGNYYGIPVFNNAWELWYLVAAPPKRSQLAPPNLADHIAANQTLPDLISVPASPADYNATQNVVESSKG
jgi:hypothetical protein